MPWLIVARVEPAATTEITATATTRSPDPTSDWRALATFGGRWTGMRPMARSRALGTTSSATNKKTAGMMVAICSTSAAGMCPGR